jgi:hypothetical protein
MYRRIITLTVLITGLWALQATQFTFVPSDREGDTDDLWDLDHHYWYTCGVSRILPCPRARPSWKRS